MPYIYTLSDPKTNNVQRRKSKLQKADDEGWEDEEQDTQQAPRLDYPKYESDFDARERNGDFQTRTH